MLLLGDRNFAAYKFFAAVNATGAGFLIRGTTGHRAMKLPATATLLDGSYQASAGEVPVRVIEAEITITTPASPALTPTGYSRHRWARERPRPRHWWIYTSGGGKSKPPTAN